MPRLRGKAGGYAVVSDGRSSGVSVQPLPIGVAASDAASPLLGAYNLWVGAEFSACIRELNRLERKLGGNAGTEAAILTARAYLRLDRPQDALSKLSSARARGDVDAQCTIESLRGCALVSAGQGASGMDAIRRSIVMCEQHNARLAVRMEAISHMAFAHWLLGEFDEAEASARIVAEAGVDILSARAVALIAWIAVGRLEYARSLQLFRDAWRLCRACAGRDLGFEASVVHAVASYDSQLLNCGSNPRYYGIDLPGAGKAIDTYRLLVGSVDAWRATLAGDEARALELAASTEAADVADHWRVFGMVSRAGILQALGYDSVGSAISLAAFASAMSLDWSSPPGESRFALLYLAERLAPTDLDRARTCLSAFARIRASPELRYFAGRHPLHEALESHSRGAVAVAAGDTSGCAKLEDAARLFERFGFRWRAAGARLLLGRASSDHAEVESARAYIMQSFPKSHLARRLGGSVPLPEKGSGVELSPAQAAIVRALCSGRSPKDIARDRGTSVGTVRNQLKEVYRRTGLRSIQSIVTTYCRIVDVPGASCRSRKEHDSEK